jgi:hypothetical protein
MSLRCVAHSRRLRLSLIALTHGYPLTPTQLQLSKSIRGLRTPHLGVRRGLPREPLRRSPGVPLALLEGTSPDLPQAAPPQTVRVCDVTYRVT